MLFVNRNYDLFNDLFENLFEETSKEGTMITDIKEVENQYVFESELPGYKKEDIKISVKDDYLTIIATRNKEEAKDENKFLSSERIYGEVSRTFYVGKVDAEGITAKYVDGILTVNVPKTLKVDENKYISIE